VKYICDFVSSKTPKQKLNKKQKKEKERKEKQRPRIVA